MRRSILAIVAFVGVTASCGNLFKDAGCVVGPCLPATSPDYPITFVTGFPSSRVVDTVGYLAPGDTVRLVVVNVRSSETPCTARDTVRDGVQWGTTDTSVATITATSNGEGLLTARATGPFRIAMMMGQTTPLDPLKVAPRYVGICPRGGVVGRFQVTP